MANNLTQGTSGAKRGSLKPWEENGLTYGYNSAGERVCTGSMMGRRSQLPDDTEAPVKLRMEKMRWYDGAYDKGGAYWGAGTPVYCAYTDDWSAVVFVRGKDRDQAKQRVRDQLSHASFYR